MRKGYFIAHLDVTDPDSVRRAAAKAGPIDALVNNAGVGLLSIFEGTPEDTIRAVFETNLFGAMALTRAFLPVLRDREGSVIVNVSSSTTLKPLPMLSVYTASKAALNAFTESLALELEPAGVRVASVVPGQAPGTSFATNARARMQERGVSVPEGYAAFAEKVFERMAGGPAGPHTESQDVADAIWRAVTEPSSPGRQLAGADAIAAVGG